MTNRARAMAILAAAAGLSGCAAGFAMVPERLYPAWLTAWLFWLGLGLGAHAIMMLHNLTGGAWGLSVHRVLDAATCTLPLMALLFLPLAFGLPHLYPWADPARVAADHALQHRQPWLNAPFFLARAAVYFAIWIGLSGLLYRWWGQLERRFEPGRERAVRVVSAIGIALYGLTVTFSMVDWVMSLDPKWYSTIFGAIFMTSQALSAIAFAVVSTLLMARRVPGAPRVPRSVLNDLGNLLLAFTMVWTYMAFSQFLIIWSGNLPEEIAWFKDRMEGGWQALAVGILLFGFALPFLLLLLRRAKRARSLLLSLAFCILGTRLVDLHWTVAPSLSPRRFTVHLLDLAAVAGIGGLWTLVFLAALRRRPITPRAAHDEAGEANPGDLPARAAS